MEQTKKLVIFQVPPRMFSDLQRKKEQSGVPVSEYLRRLVQNDLKVAQNVHSK